MQKTNQPKARGRAVPLQQWHQRAIRLLNQHFATATTLAGTVLIILTCAHILAATTRVAAAQAAPAALSPTSIPAALGYTGEQMNPDGTIYLRARTYNPNLGRFLQRDEFAGLPSQPTSLNRYAYTTNNPTNLTDPTGKCPTCVAAGTGAVIGGGLSYGTQVIGNLAAGQSLSEAATNIRWRDVAAGAVGGAIGGATGSWAGGVFGGTFGNGLVGRVGSGVLAGGFSNGFGQVVTNLAAGTCWSNGLRPAVALGMVTGGIGGGFNQPVSNRGFSANVRSDPVSQLTVRQFNRSIDMEALNQFVRESAEYNSARGYGTLSSEFPELAQIMPENMHVAITDSRITGVAFALPDVYNGTPALKVQFLEGIGGGSGTRLMQHLFEQSPGQLTLQSVDSAAGFYQKLHPSSVAGSTFVWNQAPRRLP